MDETSGSESGRIPATMPKARGQLVLVRHGETEWSRTGRHTGLTDVPLTERGEKLATAIGALLVGRRFALVATSPLERARRTAELAGLHAPEMMTLPDLKEWDYGGYEGLTTPEIREHLGRSWTVFQNGVVPGETPGETVEQVASRVSRVLGVVLPHLADGDVALVGHGHCLRILAAVYLAQEPRFASRLQLDAPSVSVLDMERGVRTVRIWNLTVDLLDGR